MDFKNLVQGSPEWLEYRKKGIGASDVAAILGKCPYSTPYKVWLDKTGRSIGNEQNFAMIRGNDLEGKARAKYELVAMEDMPPALAEHPKYSILRASLDGIRADGKLILEIKCPGAQSHQMALDGLVPDHYMVQIQTQLLVTGADMCHYFSYSYKDSTHALVEVLPDIAMQAEIVVKVTEFWNNYVLTDTPPPLTSKDDKLVSEGKVLEICQHINKFKDSIRKEKLDTLKQEIIEHGGHDRIRCGNILVTKSVKNGKESFRITFAKEAESVESAG